MQYFKKYPQIGLILFLFIFAMLLGFSSAVLATTDNGTNPDVPITTVTHNPDGSTTVEIHNPGGPTIIIKTDPNDPNGPATVTTIPPPTPTDPNPTPIVTTIPITDPIHPNNPNLYCITKTETYTDDLTGENRTHTAAYCGKPTKPFPAGQAAIICKGDEDCYVGKCVYENNADGSLATGNCLQSIKKSADEKGDCQNIGDQEECVYFKCAEPADNPKCVAFQQLSPPAKPNPSECLDPTKFGQALVKSRCSYTECVPNSVGATCVRKLGSKIYPEYQKTDQCNPDADNVAGQLPGADCYATKCAYDGGTNGDNPENPNDKNNYVGGAWCDIERIADPKPSEPGVTPAPPKQCDPMLGGAECTKNLCDFSKNGGEITGAQCRSAAVGGVIGVIPAAQCCGATNNNFSGLAAFYPNATDFFDNGCSGDDNGGLDCFKPQCNPKPPSYFPTGNDDATCKNEDTSGTLKINDPSTYQCLYPSAAKCLSKKCGYTKDSSGNVTAAYCSSKYAGPSFPAPKDECKEAKDCARCSGTKCVAGATTGKPCAGPNDCKNTCNLQKQCVEGGTGAECDPANKDSSGNFIDCATAHCETSCSMGGSSSCMGVCKAGKPTSASEAVCTTVGDNSPCNHCSDLLKCSEGAPVAGQSSCSQDSECTGHCEDDTCIVGKPATGQDPCTTDAECSHCANGHCNKGEPSTGLWKGTAGCTEDTDCNSCDPSTFQCVMSPVSISGWTSCLRSSDCSHKECDSNKKCVSVAGAGIDSCTSDTDCSHKECNSDKKCVSVAGSGPDKCTTNPDNCNSCPTPGTTGANGPTGSTGNTGPAGCDHKACVNYACTEVPNTEPGQSDSCMNNTDCNQTHTACVSGSCQPVSGTGPNACVLGNNAPCTTGGPTGSPTVFLVPVHHPATQNSFLGFFKYLFGALLDLFKK